MNTPLTPEMAKLRAEYERKADQAAINIRYAANKQLAIRTFLRYLALSIDPTSEVSI